jgi:5-methylcytosine-specific restriction endonuclease McrA
MPRFQAWLVGIIAGGSPSSPDDWGLLLAEAGALRSQGLARLIAEAIRNGLYHSEEIEAIAHGDFVPSAQELLRHPAITARVRQPVPLKLRRMVVSRDGHRCQLCGSDRHLQVDHFVPLILGGTNALVNLWTLCRACNGPSGKGGLFPSKTTTERWVAQGRAFPPEYALALSVAA